MVRNTRSPKVALFSNNQWSEESRQVNLHESDPSRRDLSEFGLDDHTGLPAAISEVLTMASAVAKRILFGSMGDPYATISHP